jgi:hypothetical protein
VLASAFFWRATMIWRYWRSGPLILNSSPPIARRLNLHTVHITFITSPAYNKLAVVMANRRIT